MRLKERRKDSKEKVAFKRVKNNARISYSERKQLGRSQNINLEKVYLVLNKNI